MTQQELVPRTEPSEALSLIVNPDQVMAGLKQLKELVGTYLVKGEDFGLQPGTDKNALFQSGAQKLQEIYGLYPVVAVLEKVEDWDRLPALFDYTIEAKVLRRRDDKVMGVGLGSCNSWESKYRWRTQKRACPVCNSHSIKTSKRDWGGGYYCCQKHDGCGASWKEFDTSKSKASDKDKETVKQIREQQTGRVPNDDIASQKNTILKMAVKRAIVAATINATRSASIFTQDVADEEKAAETKQTFTERWNNLKEMAKANGWTYTYLKDWAKIERESGLEQDDILAEAAIKFSKPAPKNAEPEPSQEDISDAEIINDQSEDDDIYRSGQDPIDPIFGDEYE